MTATSNLGSAFQNPPVLTFGINVFGRGGYGRFMLPAKIKLCASERQLSSEELYKTWPPAFLSIFIKKVYWLSSQFCNLSTCNSSHVLFLPSSDSSTELSHTGLICCIGHAHESHGGRWFIAPTLATDVPHSTNLGCGDGSKHRPRSWCGFCPGCRSRQAHSKHIACCVPSSSFPMAWLLPQTLWPTGHTALEGSQIHPSSFARHGLSWDKKEARTLLKWERMT